MNITTVFINLSILFYSQICFAFVIACALAAPEPSAPNAVAEEAAVAASEPVEVPAQAREKKQACESCPISYP